MKKTKFIISAALAVIAILSPVIIMLSAVFLTPAQFGNSFVGALDDKYDRLTSIEEPKTVVIGGSSVAFGLDSAMMEEYLGTPVVNFGLYAAIGTKAMLDLSRDHIKEGDTVIIAPELDPQTLSLYFSSKNTLEALDGNYGMAFEFGVDNILSLLGGMWKHGMDKLRYFFTETPDPEGVYNSKNFNEYGDVVWDRKENVMQFYYDPNTVIDLSPDIVSDDFIDYLNAYIDHCTRRGAKVYFSWCPMNEMALKEGTTVDTMYAFSDYLRSKINCKFISYIDSYVMEAGYFYDTNYHLNDAGVILRTKTLIEDIYVEQGNFNLVDVEVPEAPALPQLDTKFFGEDENAKYFTYTQLENGAMAITGLTELGKAQETLTVPLGAEYCKVTTIMADAFANSNVKSLIITADSNLRNLMDGSLNGITDLWTYCVYIEEGDGYLALLPPSDMHGIRVHIPPNSVYLTDYNWGDTQSKGHVFVQDATEE